MDLALVGDQRLRRRPVPVVPSAAGRLSMRLIAQAVGQLDLHRPLDHPLGQLRQQPALTGDLLASPGAGHELVDQLVRQQLLDAISEPRVGVRTVRSASASLSGSRGGCPSPACGSTPLSRLI